MSATHSSSHFDVLIVGAGLSGIGAACHLRRQLPGLRFAILERREALGGTWDLFRYPGVRSDSDMSTFGYSFKPWTEPKVLADGRAIRDYLAQTAREYDLPRHIRYGHKVCAYDWSETRELWELSVEVAGQRRTLSAEFVINATGYYDYDRGHQPDFPGAKDFAGRIVHPQHWPEDLDYAGKRVVVIGSGATAITLVPAMAATAAQVTMLQRSPTDVLSVPSIDPLASRLRRLLPEAAVYKLTRARNIALQRLLYRSARSRPRAVRRLLRMGQRHWLGPDFDLRHFQPRYAPWDQRLCVVPDGDLFRALRSGRAGIVTDEIARFEADGIVLASGQKLQADIVVSATGLRLQMLGGATLRVDGATVDVSQRMVYKGMMLEGVPNAAVIFGYTNASWTLKADLVMEHVCRLLRHMRRRGIGSVRPRLQAGGRSPDTVMGGLSAGYVQRAAGVLPRQGTQGPWRVLNDYLHDAPLLRYGPLRDPELECRTGARRQRAGQPGGLGTFWRRLRAA